MVVRYGSYISVKELKSETPAQLVTLGNITGPDGKSTLKVHYQETGIRPNRIAVAYTDEDYDYRQEIAATEDPAAVVAGERPLPCEVELYGITRRHQALREGLTRCDAIFFTHNHVDHTFGLDEVRRFNAVQKSAIEIHADDHTMDSLERTYRHIFDKDRNVNSSFVATLLPFRIHAEQIEQSRPTRLFGVNFIPIPLLHGRLPILGWRIEPDEELLSPEAREFFPLAYCTDVSAVPPGSWRILQGVKTLVLDALRHRAHPTHLTLDQALSIAEHVDAQHTYFVHMAHDLPHQATQDQLPERRFLAYDRLTLPQG
jgi:phosphoribosyl 1,2-cyclic phosphate phosphodiesterase